MGKKLFVLLLICGVLVPALVTAVLATGMDVTPLTLMEVSAPAIHCILDSAPRPDAAVSQPLCAATRPAAVVSSPQ